ncbi:hypothetical protein GJ496_008517 [Pomphorhynchus laevis]|nr:hypothetical protein GJ496_008517 [Pomphorhynchus laevis]
MTSATPSNLEIKPSELNMKMHFRNKYKYKTPNFIELAKQFPEFERYLKKTNKLDFSDPQAVASLSHAILKADFNLDVELSANNLVPCITSKLNYLLYVEDLLTCAGMDLSEELHGLDIGCGGSCIHALLACQMHDKWIFTATEIDEQSIELANRNIIRNELSHRITVVKPDQEGPPYCPPGQFDFCLCNPPFFKNINEAQCLHKREKLNATVCGSINEIVYADGGEQGFVEHIFNMSKLDRFRIKLYAIMLGKKETLLYFLGKFTDIKSKEVFYFTHGQICQGKTMRWVLAWGWNISNFDVFIMSPLGHRALPLPVYTKAWLAAKVNLTEEIKIWACECGYSDESVHEENNAIVKIELKTDGNAELKHKSSGDVSWAGLLRDSDLKRLIKFLIKRSRPCDNLQLT